MANLVEIIVRAKDDTKAGFAAASASSDGLNAKLQKIGMIGAAGLAAVGVASVAMAAKFDASMEMIHTQAGVAQNQIAGLKSGVLDLAGKVGFSPDSLADALYHIESSFASVGIKGPQALNLLKVAAEGAAVGHANLTDVTNALDAAIASGIPGVQNMNQAMGVLNATVGAGDMKMQDLADAFGTGAVAVVKGFGLSIKDVGAALATYGDNNIRGAQAGTALRVAVQALAAPIKAGIPVLASLGIGAKQLGEDMQKGGLLQAITDLKTHMDAAGISATQQGQIITEAFGKKAGTGINILLGQFDRFKSKYADMSRGAGQFGQAWAATQQTASQQFKELEASVESLAIQLGEKLMPYAQKLMTFFLSHKQTVIDVAIGVGILAAALATFSIVAKTTAAVMAILDAVMAANPVTIIVLAIVGLVAAFIILWNKFAAFRDFWKTTWKIIQDAFTLWWNYVKNIFLLLEGVILGFWKMLETWWKTYGPELTQIWKAIWDALTTAVKAFWDIFGPFIKAEWDLTVALFKDAIAILEAVFKTLWDVLAALVKVAWDGIESVVKTAWDIIVGLFQVAIDLLTGHWSKAWNDLLNIGKQVWNNISSYFSGAWHAIAELAGQIFGNVELALSKVWDGVKSTAESVWGTIVLFFQGLKTTVKNAFDAVVNAIKISWGAVETVFKTPVNFLIGTVYDNGIERLWNDIMGAIGGPKLPNIATLATGGRLPGYGGGDQHLALLESGEAVVDKDRTRKFAPLLKAMGVPGFSGGGIIGSLTGALGWLGGEAAGLITDLEKGSGTVLASLMSKLIGNGGASGELASMITGIPKTLIADLIGSVTFSTSAKKIQQEKAAADAAAAAAVGAVGGGGLGGSAAANRALMQKMAAARGWTGLQWTDLDKVEMREAGYSMTAKNPGSDAYGMAQFINGPSEYYQYGGNPNTAAGQITAMLNYIAQRYGTPAGAWASEVNNGYYAKGGIGGGLAMVGEHGRELVKLPQGSTVYSNAQSESMLARMMASQGGTVQLEVSSGGQGEFEAFMSKFIKNYVRIKGGGNVQAAFGRT